MSDSDWSERTKVELRHWIPVAVVLVTAFVLLGLVQHGLYYNEATKQAENYARQANDEIVSECTIPATKERCSYEIKERYRENHRKEYDLYSQKAMALWTGVMGVMAMFGIGLSGLGVFLIWQTWGATQIAADNSQKTLESFKIAEGGTYLVSVKHWSDIVLYGDFPEAVSCELETKQVGNAMGITEIEWGVFDTEEWPDRFPHGGMPLAKSVTVRPKADEGRFLLGYVKYDTMFGPRSVGFRYQIGKLSVGRISDFEEHCYFRLRYLNASDWPSES